MGSHPAQQIPVGSISTGIFLWKQNAQREGPPAAQSRFAHASKIRGFPPHRKALGKNHPFIVLGQVLLFGMTFVLFRIVPTISAGSRFIAFIIIYCIYILGYTFQCVVTKSAQSCLTNDPQQRPMFAMFDSTYTVLYNSIFWPIYLSGTPVPKYSLSSATTAAELDALLAKIPSLVNVLVVKDGVSTLSGLYNPGLWQEAQLTVGILSAIMAVFGIIGLWRKDSPKSFGIGKAQRVRISDYVDVMAHNRGIQMLVVAASSDKLARTCTTNSAVTMSLFGVIFGSFALNGSVSALSGIPIMLFAVFGVGIVAMKFYPLTKEKMESIQDEIAAIKAKAQQTA